MLFQILDSNNQVVEAKVLDKQACEIWKKPVSEHQFATPHPKQSTDVIGITEGVNWVDTLGWSIAQGYNTWDKLREALDKTVQDVAKNKKELSYLTKRLKKPYLKLIEVWEKKGYVPSPVLPGISSSDSEANF